MTREQAYIEGFCKAAEEAGVDPVELYKRAGLFGGLVGGGVRLAGKSLRAGGRYVNRLFGGKVGKMDKGLGKLNRLAERTTNRLTEAGMAGDRAAVMRNSDLLDRIALRRGILEAQRAAEAGAVRNARVGTAIAGSAAAGAGVASTLRDDYVPEVNRIKR